MIIAEDQKRFLKFRNGANFEGQKHADENVCILTCIFFHLWWNCHEICMVNCPVLVTYGWVVLELKRFDVNRSVFILIELIWAGSVLFLVLVHADCDTVWNRLAWEYTYIANYRMRDEDMRETAGRGSASSDLSHWADSWTPLAAAPMIDGSPVSPFLLRRVTPNGRYTKVRELKEDFL